MSGYGIRLKLIVGLLLGLCLSVPPLFAHGSLHDQISDLSKKIQSGNSTTGDFLKRAELYALHGDFTNALADCENAKKSEPDSRSPHFVLGTILYEAGRFAEARVSLDYFLSKQPTATKALLTRGRVLLKLGDAVGAASDFEKVIEHARPLEPDYFLEYAQALQAAGKSEKALAALDLGITSLGDIPGLHVDAIQLEIALSHYEKALRRVEILANRSPRKETWLNRKAEILELAGRLSEARTAYQEALSAISLLPARQQQTPVVISLRKQIAARIQHLENGTNK